MASLGLDLGLRPYAGGVSAASYVAPLDALSPTDKAKYQHAWGPALWTTDYTGPLVRLVPLAGGAERDFDRATERGVDPAEIMSWAPGGAEAVAWYDQVGGADLTPPAGAAPTFSATGFNGQPTFDFASNAHLVNNDVAALLAGDDQPYTVLAAVQPAATNTVRAYLALGHSTLTGQWLQLGQDNAANWRVSRVGSASVNSTVSYGEIAVAPYCVLVDWRSTANGMKLRQLRNDRYDIDDIAHDTTPVTSDRFCVGGLLRNTFTNGWNGLISSVAVADDNLALPQQIKLQRAFNAVFDIEGSLSDRTLALDYLGLQPFTQPRMIYDLGTASYIFSGVAGKETSLGRNRVGQWWPATEVLESFNLGTATGGDDHNEAAILNLLGNLFTSYSGHDGGGGIGTRYRQATGMSIAGLGAESHFGAVQTLTVSYNKPFYLSGPDKFVLLYRANRTAGAGTPDWCWRMLVAGSDLSSPAEIDFVQSALYERPYPVACQDGDDKIHVLFTNALPTNTNTGQYHFYIQWVDGSPKYFQTDGTEITATLPFIIETDTTPVYLYDSASEKSWGWDIKIGSDGHPRVLYGRYPSETDHRLYYARWTGSAWVETQIVAAGSYFANGSRYYLGGMCFDGNDPDIVYLSRTTDDENWDIEEWHTADDGATWALDNVIDNSGGLNFRPVSPAGHDANLKVAWNHIPTKAEYVTWDEWYYASWRYAA